MIATVSDEGHLLAETYLANGSNRAVVDRTADLSGAAERLAGHNSPVEFMLGDEFRRHATATLVDIADAWDAQRTGPVRRVLDAGCGAGITTRALADRYPDADLVGIDVEEPALALARYLSRDHGRTRFLAQPLEELDLPERFDVIQCRSVLEHVFDPERVLGVLLAHLAPGGVLYVETPNYVFPWEPHLRVPILLHGPRPLLRALCRVLGRDVAFVDHLNLECNPVIIRRWARRADPSMRVVDLMAAKAAAIFDGDVCPTVGRRARVVGALDRVPAARLLARTAFTRLPIAPSVMLLFVRPA